MTNTDTITVCGNCDADIAPEGDCSCLREYDRRAPYAREVVAVDHYTLGLVYVVADAPESGEVDPPSEWRADPARFR